MTDREELAKERDELIELLAEIYGYVGDAIERDSDALLQSDWLARHDRALRVATLNEAADEIRIEARWQQEQQMRGLTEWRRSIDRLAMLERILLDRAAAVLESTEGQ